MKHTPQTPYPLGTRIAEGYGMDLDREAAEGRPALFGARVHEEAQPADAPFLLRADVLTVIIGAVALYAVYRLRAAGVDWTSGKDWLLQHLRSGL